MYSRMQILLLPGARDTPYKEVITKSDECRQRSTRCRGAQDKKESVASHESSTEWEGSGQGSERADSTTEGKNDKEGVEEESQRPEDAKERDGGSGGTAGGVRTEEASRHDSSAQRGTARGQKGRWGEQESMVSAAALAAEGTCNEWLGDEWLRQWSRNLHDMCTRDPSEGSDMVSDVTCR